MADPDDETHERRIFGQQKASVAKLAVSWAYHLTEVFPLQDSPEAGYGRVVWDGPVDYSADDLLAGEPKKPERVELNRRDKVLLFLNTREARSQETAQPRQAIQEYVGTTDKVVRGDNGRKVINRVLEELLEDERVERVDVGANKYEYWLTNDGTDEAETVEAEQLTLDTDDEDEE